MTRQTGEEAQRTLEDYLERQRLAFVVTRDNKTPTSPLRITETFSNKTITFALGQVEDVEEARNPQGSKYLRVRLDDGRSFAFAGIGLVFAPSFVSTGPVPECPATASFRDFEKLFGHLKHVVDDHHEGHEAEALQVFMVLLAFLDGARAIGLDVGREEGRLEPVLKKLEDLGLSV